MTSIRLFWVSYKTFKSHIRLFWVSYKTLFSLIWDLIGTHVSLIWELSNSYHSCIVLVIMSLTLILLMGVTYPPNFVTTTSPELWNRQRSSNALSWLFLNMAGLQNAVLIGGTPCNKNPIWWPKKRKYASHLLSFVAHIISRVPGLILTKIPMAIPMFPKSSSSQSHWGLFCL